MMSKNARLIFYDLSIDAEYKYSPVNISELRSLCNVEYRRFAFEKYPSIVRQLEHFRWKPIVIAVSEIFSHSYLDDIKNRVGFKKGSCELSRDIVKTVF